MAFSYNVVLLVDTADQVLKDRIRLVSLRLLNFLACRVGLGQVRWSYRFLNSMGGRCRPPRRSDLRELRPRSWNEFEDELEACLERARSSRSCGTHGSRAVLTHTALMDTLSDFQWDRPDITSPAKPAFLKSRRGGRIIPVDEPLKADSPSEKNAVFLLSPCPHSQSQLAQFASGTQQDIELQQVIDKLLSRALQSIIMKKKVTLYWLDTTDWTEVWSCADHSGYWTMLEIMQHVGGRLLPSESLLRSSGPKSANHFLLSKIPFDSVLNFLTCNEQDYRVWFPKLTGVVFFLAHGTEKKWECAVTLEPVSLKQHYVRSMTITLKGTVENWSHSRTASLSLDTWVLQNSTAGCHISDARFQHLLQTLVSRGLHMVADVSTEEDLTPRTGILSPFSESAALLNVINNEKAIGLDNIFLPCSINDNHDDLCELPDIVTSVINHVYSTEEKAPDIDPPVPDWVKQELTHSSPWTSSFVEKWYPFSGTSGASSNLMESFRLINAASFDQDEHSKSDQELTNYLSELYQKKNNEEFGIAQGENQKKRGLHCTPVRRKMKTMSRSLQMLNAARLNVKAQKIQPDNVQQALNEKNVQMKRRSSERPEEKGKALKASGFKTEEELVSFLNTDYEKTVSLEDNVLLSYIRNAVAIIKQYFKSNGSKQIEVDAAEKMKVLLKTSKSLRQQYGNHDKELKIRECQMQVLLRLEMCVQCQSIQANTDELEQTVEEITDMLRIISLTEDPSFLAKFLKTVLVEYIPTIPQILADIYFSLGTQIPEDLAAALPADDDSIILEGRTPTYSQNSISGVPSLAPINSVSDQLEELRTRSAKKRRSSTLARHRSVAESSQTMRQIEMPKRQLNKENSHSNLVVMVEKLKLPQKEAEATKVRRNLFVQENVSPSKRASKMPRSQSVSAVEGLKHKRSKSHDGGKDYKLLTKKVTETPVHKQITNRLLHKQIKGRHSVSTTNISIVEESPEKDIREIDLRRSPRIKQLSLTRRNSSSFYSSQPRSRNLERVHSATMQQQSVERTGSKLLFEVKTPKRLLFGEVLQMNRSPTTRSAKRNLSEVIDPVFCQALGKIQRKTPQKGLSTSEDPSEKGKVLHKSPCTPRTPARTPKGIKTPCKSSSERKSAAKNLGKLFSPSKFETHSPLRKSERLLQMTPGKETLLNKCFWSPLKNTKGLTTPHKEGESNFLYPVFKSPLKTPKGRLTITTPSKQSPQTARTPGKSPHKLSESVAETHSNVHTPQKPIFVSVSHTPTPKKSVEKELFVVLSRVKECTPGRVHVTPKKHISMKKCSLSPSEVLNGSFPISPSIRISGSSENVIPHLSLTPGRPRRTPLKNVNPVCSKRLTDTFGSPNKTPEEMEEGNHNATFNLSPKTKVLTPTKDVNNKSTPLFQISDPLAIMGHTDNLLLPNVTSTDIEPVSKYDTVISEQVDSSFLGSSQISESFVNSSQTTEESIDISEARVVPGEASGLKMKVLITRKPSLDILPFTPKSYSLRCTPDRRQREAEARLGTPEFVAKFSTPKSHRKIVPPVTPTYEVELQMQASGLPKLRFKRTDSGSVVDNEAVNKAESPVVSRKRKGNESPFSEKWCNKHGLKVDSSSASPCIRSSYNTPGKNGLQTFICQSYTPNRCSSNAASPSNPDFGHHCSPSPKHKDKVITDVINNWPRKKKASILNNCLLRGDKNQEFTDLGPTAEEEVYVGSEHEKEKDILLEDFGLDGVCRLQENSPVIEWQGKDNGGTFGLKSRKRCFDLVSPSKETIHCNKRACTVNSNSDGVVKNEAEMRLSSKSLSSNLSSSQQSDDDVFSFPGFTPPNKILKHSLSTSGLLALTQSPMLFRGKTPSSKRKVMQDGDPTHTTPKGKSQELHTADSEESPFSRTVSGHTFSRTYSRKKLIT